MAALCLDASLETLRDKLERTALAEIPEETLVQKQPPLRPSRLIVSSTG